MESPTTAPLSRSAILRLDRDTGTLRSREYVLTVLSGPDAGKRVPLSGTVFVGTHPQSGVCLTDPSVSRYHLEIRVRQDGVRVRDVNSTNGTFMGGTRVETVVVEKEAVLTIGSSVLRIALEELEVGKASTSRDQFGGAIGKSAAMRQLFGLLERVAPQDINVLLLGETGTGKEVLAQAIHRESKRRDGPFVVVDCGAVAPDLIESELFGHVKGAFTGAVSDRQGAFLRADGGTIFLDEIGELPLSLQPKFLRVLESRVVRRVGEDKPRKVDVRVISATHRDLEAEVEAGRFRRDLFFRLAVVVANVPPLRERLEEIPALVKHFVQQMGRGEFELPPGLLQKLQSHHWPGNVRELKNVVHRALAGVDLREGAEDRAEKPVLGVPFAPEALKALPFRDAKEQIVDAFARDYLATLLEQHKGNLSAVARTAKLNRNYVHRLVVKYGLKAVE